MFIQGRQFKKTMQKQLAAYMLLLAGLLLAVIFAGLLLFGRFDTAKQTTYESLNFQMKIFEKEVDAYFNSLAAGSLDLSRYVTDFLEQGQNISGKNFESLNNNPKKLEKLQSALIGVLEERLKQHNASGIFVMFDATVNSVTDDAKTSKSGLYLQQNRFLSNQDISLYRGISSVGKKQGMMPHRKWRLEFQTSIFPDYDQIERNAQLPLNESYMITSKTVLSGTSDDVILMVVPIVGSDGTYYGACGYEISNSYFATYHSQPSTFSRLTCMLTTWQEKENDYSVALSCSGTDGFAPPPTTTFSMKKNSGNLRSYSDGEEEYVGISRSISLTPNNNNHALTVMIPKEDYNHEMLNHTLQTVILIALLLFFAVSCCLYFSKRYLSPLIKSMEQIKQKDYTKNPSHAEEINDLLEFLSEQDEELNQSRLELQRLSYARKTEVEPDNYQVFLMGLKTLTPTERNIFEYYLQGKTVKEIIELTGVKESTIRFHNRNIYSKLNVTSLKQLLLYAAMMKQTEGI